MRYTAFTLYGHVLHAQWPDSGNPIDTIPSQGKDWALVRFSNAFMDCNTFRAPGTQKPQQVTGYVKTKDLISGEVWVCAGVSGIQLGFLKHHPASLVMSKSLFGVRSISLERPLGMYLPLRLRMKCLLISILGQS